MALIPSAQMTRAEFDTLPATVRRKFFSTSEQLQFERPAPSAVSRRSSSPRQVHYTHTLPAYHNLFAPGLLPSSRTPICPPPRPVHCSALRPAAYTTHQTPPIVPTDGISAEFARFYQQLPDKVKRRQFSPEERELLESHAERVTPRLSQEKAARLSRNRSVPSLRSASTGRASSASESIDELPTLYAEHDDMDAELMGAFQWIEESHPDLTLDDYHSHVANVEPKHKWLSQVTGFRRHRSYTNFSARNGTRQSAEHRTATAQGPHSGPFNQSWMSPSPTKDSAPPPLPSLEILKATTVTVHQSPPNSPFEVHVPARQVRVTAREWGTGWVPALAKESPPRVSEKKRERGLTQESSPSQPKSAASERARETLEEWGSGWAPLPTTPKSAPIRAEHAPRLSPEARLKLEKYLAEPTKPEDVSALLSGSRLDSVSDFAPSLGYGEVSGATFLDDDAATDASRTAPMEEESVEDAPTFGHSDARPTSSSYEPTHSGPPSPRTAPLSGDVTAPSSHKSDSRAPYIYALPPVATGREMTVRMTLTRPELREDARAILPPTPAYVQQYQPPRMRFMGAKREVLEPITIIPASRNPLGLDELFAPDPLPLRQERSGLLKLFARK